ncbi:MAG: CdaR family protein [Bacteroidales bacterium]|nr:CdaR family protein [Bacteroidales bacterium]
MDTNLLKQFGNIFRRQKTKFKVRLAVFSFFFVVALILWYLNKLSYEYTADVNFPVRFENMPKGKVLVGDPPKSVTLNVRGFGYTLLRYRVSSRLTTISINLNSAGLIAVQGEEHKFMLITNRSRHLFSGYLHGDLILEKVSPDTLSFHFTELAERKVAVSPRVTYTLKKQYMIAGDITVNPDSVTLSGPQAIIDTITSVQTEKQSFIDLNQTLQENISLVSIPQVSLSHRNAKITIPVERFTEANFSLPIEVKNLPDSLRLIVLPRSVNVKCNVVVSDYQDIENSSVSAYVDFNEAKLMLDNKLRVRVMGKVHSVTNLSFEPKFVEFIIEKL